MYYVWRERPLIAQTFARCCGQVPAVETRATQTTGTDWRVTCPVCGQAHRFNWTNDRSARELWAAVAMNGDGQHMREVA